MVKWTSGKSERTLNQNAANGRKEPKATELLRLVESPLSAAGLAFLDRWAWNSCVRTVDAAIPLKRFQDGLTRLAFIEPLACISRHRLSFNVSTRWTGESRLQHYFCVFCRHIAYPVSIRNPANIGSKKASL